MPNQNQPSETPEVNSSSDPIIPNSQPPVEPGSEVAMDDSQSKPKSRVWLLLGIILALLIGAGVGSYFVFGEWWTKKETTVTTKTSLPEKMTVLLTGDAITGIYPNSQPEVYETNFQRNIFQSLTQVQSDGRAVGLLAESWANPDPSTWVFTLREDAVFSNNEPVLAKDVVFSINEAQANEWPGSEHIAQVATSEVVTERQVKITTDGVAPVLLNQLAQVLIINQAQYEAKQEDDYAVGSGAYTVSKVASQDDGGKIFTLLANPNYYLTKPEVTTLSVLSQPEGEDRVDYGIKHNASVILVNSLTKEQQDELRDKGYVFKSAVSNTVNLIGFDTLRASSPYVTGVSDNPLQKKEVRLALYQAIDFDKLAQTPPDTSWVTATQLAPVSVFGHDPEISRPEHNVAAAKKALTDAGYPNGFSLVIDTPAPNASQLDQIVEDWKEIGVNLTVNPLGKTDGLPKLMNHDTSAYYIGIEMGTYDFATGFAEMIDPENPINFGQYRLNAAVSLQGELATTLNLEQRKAKLQQLQKILLVDVGFIPVWFSSDVHAVKSDIDFVEVSPATWKAR